jgi:hypothetical protein
VKPPSARGTLSAHLLEELRRDEPRIDSSVAADDGDDEQLALWVLHALHYTGLDGVPEAHEWHPDVLAVRIALERALEHRLRERHPGHELPADLPTDVGADRLAEELFAFIAGHDGPSVASYVQRQASTEQVLQLLRWRSLYHLRESDPTAFVVPRLDVRTKAALIELQYDEYGGGDPNRLHSHLFARGLAACGLDPTPGAHVDEVPAEVLELNNAMTLFGLHRRLRGAALGHLAAFEATSSLPSRRMAQGLGRLELPDEMIEYYQEHVEADAVHEQLAVRTICGSLLDDDPGLVDDVFFGAFSCLDLESRMAARLLDEWADRPREEAS